MIVPPVGLVVVRGVGVCVVLPVVRGVPGGPGVSPGAVSRRSLRRSETDYWRR